MSNPWRDNPIFALLQQGDSISNNSHTQQQDQVFRKPVQLPKGQKKPAPPQQPSAFKKSASVQPPNVYKDSSSVQQISGYQGASGQQPNVFKNTTPVQQPSVFKSSSSIQQKGGYQDPAFKQQPSVFRNAAPVQQPGVFKNPASVQQHSVFKNPVSVQQHTVFKNPASVQQHTVFKSPASEQQPSLSKNPGPKQKPQTSKSNPWRDNPIFELLNQTGGTTKNPNFEQWPDTQEKPVSAHRDDTFEPPTSKKQPHKAKDHALHQQTSFSKSPASQQQPYIKEPVLTKQGSIQSAPQQQQPYQFKKPVVKQQTNVKKPLSLQQPYFQKSPTSEQLPDQHSDFYQNFSLEQQPNVFQKTEELQQRNNPLPVKDRKKHGQRNGGKTHLQELSDNSYGNTGAKKNYFETKKNAGQGQRGTTWECYQCGNYNFEGNDCAKCASSRKDTQVSKVEKRPIFPDRGMRCNAVGCTYNEWFRTHSRYHEHWRRFHVPRVELNYCTACRKKFIKMTDAQRHVQEIHSGEKAEVKASMFDSKLYVDPGSSVEYRPKDSWMHLESQESQASFQTPAPPHPFHHQYETKGFNPEEDRHIKYDDSLPISQGHLNQITQELPANHILFGRYADVGSISFNANNQLDQFNTYDDMLLNSQEDMQGLTSDLSVGPMDFMMQEDLNLDRGMVTRDRPQSLYDDRDMDMVNERLLEMRQEEMYGNQLGRNRFRPEGRRYPNRERSRRNGDQDDFENIDMGHHRRRDLDNSGFVDGNQNWDESLDNGRFRDSDSEQYDDLPVMGRQFCVVGYDAGSGEPIYEEVMLTDVGYGLSGDAIEDQMFQGTDEMNRSDDDFLGRSHFRRDERSDMEAMLPSGSFVVPGPEDVLLDRPIELQDRYGNFEIQGDEDYNLDKRVSGGSYEELGNWRQRSPLRTGRSRWSPERSVDRRTSRRRSPGDRSPSRSSRRSTRRPSSRSPLRSSRRSPNHSRSKRSPNRSSRRRSPHHSSSRTTPDHSFSRRSMDHLSSGRSPDYSSSRRSPDYSSNRSSKHSPSRRSPNRSSSRRSSEERRCQSSHSVSKRKAADIKTEVTFVCDMTCPACPYSMTKFKTLAMFQSHWRKWHSCYEYFFSCPVHWCSSSFSGRQKLIDHITDEHNKGNKLNDSLVAFLREEITGYKVKGKPQKDPGNLTFNLDDDIPTGKTVKSGFVPRDTAVVHSLLTTGIYPTWYRKVRKTCDHPEPSTSHPGWNQDRNEKEEPTRKLSGDQNHSEVTPSEIVPLFYEPGMKCPVCPQSKQYLKEVDFINHWDAYHRQFRDIYSCPFSGCFAMVPSLHSLRKHYRKAHNNGNELEREMLVLVNKVEALKTMNDLFVDPRHYSFNPQTEKCETKPDQATEIVFKADMKCPACRKGKKEFPKKHVYDQHWKQFHTKFMKRYACPSEGCTTLTASMNKLSVHYKINHAYGEILSEGEILMVTSVEAKKLRNPQFVDPLNMTYGPKNAELDEETESQSEGIGSEQSEKVDIVFEPGMKCPICPKSRNFRKVYDLTSHWMNNHVPNFYKSQCPFDSCPFIANSVYKLKFHYKGKHNNSEELSEETSKMLESVERYTIRNPKYINPGKFKFDYEKKENRRQNFDHVRKATKNREDSAISDVKNPHLDEENTRLDKENTKLDEENPLMEEENPQLDEENPQLDERNPQFNENFKLVGNPQIDEENPQFDEENPQLDGENPQFDENWQSEWENEQWEEENPELYVENPQIDLDFKDDESIEMEMDMEIDELE